jgi:predicted nucleic acid-binding protein
MNTNEDVIITQRPDGKQGIKILKSDYDLLANLIISSLKSNEDLTIQELIDKAYNAFGSIFQSNTGWYTLAVKLDLQWKGRIKIIKKTTQHKVKRILGLRLKSKRQKNS